MWQYTHFVQDCCFHHFLQIRKQKDREALDERFNRVMERHRQRIYVGSCSRCVQDIQSWVHALGGYKTYNPGFML
jgi:hypothetical protein